MVTPGLDRLYAVYLKANTTYDIYLGPEYSFDAAFYVFTDCSKPEATCLLGQDKTYSNLRYEDGAFTPKTSGTYYIGVDGRHRVHLGYARGRGAFTLGITERSAKAPANDTCAKAQTLAEPAAGKATAAVGEHTGAANSITMPSYSCTTMTTTGPDVFYQMKMTAGYVYTLFFHPTEPSIRPYIFTDCSKPIISCETFTLSHGPKNLTQTITFSPKTTQNYIIGVDNGQASARKPFSMRVTRLKAKPDNDTCATATPIPVSNGQGTIMGDTSTATNALSLGKCGLSSTLGPDLFYSVNLTAGKRYEIMALPSQGYVSGTPSIQGYDPLFYLLSSCSPVSCKAGRNGTYAGYTEKLVYPAPKSGKYIIGVDSKTTYAKGRGRFMVRVRELTTPANDTCAKAAKLTWTAGVAQASGDTSGATMTMSPSGSCKGKGTVGPDLFYALSLTAYKQYDFTVTPVNHYAPMMTAYLLSGCSASACGTGASSSTKTVNTVQQVLPATFSFFPTTSGTYYLGIDAAVNWHNVAAAGKFTMKVKEKGLATGDTCATAVNLSWVNDKFSVTGDTSTASNSYKITYTGASCTGKGVLGPDLWYRIPTQAGKNFIVQAAPASGYNLSMLVMSGCPSASGTCIKGSDLHGAGATESIVFPAAGSSTYVLITSKDTSGSGSFTLSGSR